MRSLFSCFFIWNFIITSASAQTSIDKTLETFSFTLGTMGLGTSENDFFMVKTALKKPEPDVVAFRDEVVEHIEKNGLNNIIYYFDLDGDRPLYELIIEFSDERTRIAMAEKLFGAPNYPDKPDHWIAGATDNVVTVAWAFDSKIVIAANFPGSEWYGDPLFTLPPGFEMYKHLPGMSTWPEEELAAFLATLEKQLQTDPAGFVTIRGPEATEDGYYPCLQPLHGAETANVFQNEGGKWVVSNTMISGANGENAALWKLDAENLLGKTETRHLKLKRTKSKPGFGTTINLWDITDKTGNPLGVQLGIVNYEWGAEGLWNIDLVVMQL